MIYRAIGLMSGSSLDGLDIVFAELENKANNWSYDIKAAQCVAYPPELIEQLKNAAAMSAYDYLLLHSAYGKYTGERVNAFIEEYGLHHQVQLIASHGHTVFHAPQLGMTSQLGDGAAIAATTGINVVSDLRAMDVALGGQGAPIVPVGEKLLFPRYAFCLNIGGIANLSFRNGEEYIAFDICAANRVLNMLANISGKAFDEGGAMARPGNIHTGSLTQLNALDYYKQSYPKSLANHFGTDIVYPLIQSFDLPVNDALRTYTQHIAQQIAYAVNSLLQYFPASAIMNQQMLITGGGAFNGFLIDCIKDALKTLSIEVIVPDESIVQYKEALIMALLGVLRWREENTVLSTVTGAKRSSIGGAVWMGLEA